MGHDSLANSARPRRYRRGLIDSHDRAAQPLPPRAAPINSPVLLSNARRLLVSQLTSRAAKYYQAADQLPACRMIFFFSYAAPLTLITGRVSGMEMRGDHPHEG